MVKDNKLVSIIVPVFNMEKYLDECIESILSQTYECLDIILVDDGSTDLSGRICDGWADRDTRINVIHQDNGGLSAARNSGLDAIKGEYICFVDADDYLDKHYVEAMMFALMDAGSDIAISDVNSVKLCDAVSLCDKRVVLTDKECRELLSDPNSREYVLMVVAWNKMYPRRFFDNMRFEVGRLHEDEFMINHIIYNIKSAVYIPDKNYIYRDNDEGITGKENVNDIRHLDVIDAYIQRIEIAKDNDDIEFAVNTLKWALLKLAKYYRIGDSKTKQSVKDKYSFIFDKFCYLFSKKQRLKYRLFKTAPELFCKQFV